MSSPPPYRKVGKYMKVAVIGSGGREHAIIKALKKNSGIEQLYAIPGNAGMSEAICKNIDVSDNKAIVLYCKENSIDYVVVAPDNPLVAGLVDSLEEAGIAAFGPHASAAVIEGSKVFAKNLMKKYKIPTAEYEVFDNLGKALRYVSTCSLPAVIKADGLALGKGVIIAYTREEAISAVETIMLDKKFGKSGDKIVVEEFLVGEEVSVLAFTDGKTLIPMISSMDHKRALDNDMGLNTGGMGAIAPNPYYTEEIADTCMREIFLPTMHAMNAENRRFKGCLYFGLIITERGVKVIEYNCRFGDPEAQVVLPLLKSDLLDIMLATTDERLSEMDVSWSDKHACCVILASGGYPQSYKTGFKIEGLKNTDGVYMAGVGKKNGEYCTAGGRVLGITKLGDTLRDAVDNTYRAVRSIRFEGMHIRGDIGKKALGVEK